MPIPLGILAVAGAGAAGGGGAFDLLETTLISSNTASVTFSNLNTYSDYKHLQIRVTIRGSEASILDAADIYFNGVSSGTDYARHTLQGGGSSVSSSSSTGAGRILAVFPLVSANATANTYTAGVLDILDFSSSSKNKTIRSFTGHAEGTSNQIRLISGFRASTDALTSVTFEVNSSNNFVSGSRFSLYGVK